VLPEKFLKIYKMIRVLSESARAEVKEDLQTALLDYAITLEDRSVNYIFICLRNKKIDLLRGELARCAALQEEQFDEESTETDYLEDPLSDIQDLGWIYDAFKRLAPTQRSFLLEMVRTAKSGRRVTVAALSTKFSLGRTRVYAILADIKESLSDRTAEATTEILTVSELYDRLRRWH
jgi:hypothetical protein